MSKVAEFVKFCGSQLVLLSVSGAEADEENLNAIPEQAAIEILSRASEKFEQLNIEVKSVHRSGRPAFCICDVADELGIDLIMMGCRGIGLSEEHNNDSVSNRVINLSPCPVMVIP
jgi:nucleotide-binding universal stress UspA family protein